MLEKGARLIFATDTNLGPDAIAVVFRQMADSLNRNSENLKFKSVEAGLCECDPAKSSDPDEPHYELMMLFEDRDA